LELEEIDELYRNCKSMPLITILGILFPIVLLIAAPLAIMYYSRNKKLLSNINIHEIESSSTDSVSISDKIEYLRKHKDRFFFPLIPLICLVAIGLLVGLVALFGG
jgi:hypothetical protein